MDIGGTAHTIEEIGVHPVVYTDTKVCEVKDEPNQRRDVEEIRLRWPDGSTIIIQIQRPPGWSVGQNAGCQAEEFHRELQGAI